VVTGTAALAISSSLMSRAMSAYCDSQVASCHAGVRSHGGRSDGGYGASESVWLDRNSQRES
jgi:hypothetical protein